MEPKGFRPPFTDPSIDHPYQITTGPDGNLWFTNIAGNSIGRITPSGALTTFTNNSTIYFAAGITTGPDGALWFTNEGPGFDSGSIGRITTSGVASNFTNLAVHDPGAIADGSGWQPVVHERPKQHRPGDSNGTVHLLR